MKQFEAPDSGHVLAPSYQIYLTPEFAQVLEASGKVAQQLGEDLISSEHVFVALFDAPGQAREILSRFRINKESVLKVIDELKNSTITDSPTPKKFTRD